MMVERSSQLSEMSSPPTRPVGYLEGRLRSVFSGLTEHEMPGKTGSGLSVLNTTEIKGMIRHSEIPAESMQAWQFLTSQAQTLFPAEINEVIFGESGRAQVAPILAKPNGRERVYYSGEEATVYSSMVGLDTFRLADLWDMGEQFWPYTKQNLAPADFRSVNSVGYHLLSDLTKTVPGFDQGKN